MPLPIKVCVVCHEDFELKPNKPGLVNHCPSCDAPKLLDPAAQRRRYEEERKRKVEEDAARLQALFDYLSGRATEYKPRLGEYAFHFEGTIKSE